ncbi:hypothetical protein GCM10011579_093760 [Streptomyces albiflavescens]|uniref:DUF7848 domain-containing protein n=1 Tax=Streptomyces albiflavescens TaxID=1623582 RepID=A0A917YFA4_9ACTN|nr:hypothetical protein GCM10011579_093760 [Streptomyces albiflavescens]
MTEALRTFAYPAVSTRATLDDLPVRRWVECASCIEWQDIKDTDGASAWANVHIRRNPTHDRYRLLRQTGWRLVAVSAPEDEPPPEPAR